MGRPKSFEPEQALDQAVELFWARGFEATSIDQVTEALGVTRAAVYREWGSKELLYQAALERYRQAGSEAFIAALRSDPTAAPSIVRDRLLEIIEFAVSDENNPGCFVVNATCERASLDETTATQVREALSGLERELTDALTAAVQAGACTHPDPAALARTIVTVIQGIRVVGKARPEQAAFEGVVTEVMRLFTT